MLIHIIDFNSTLISVPIPVIIGKLKIPSMFQLKIWTTAQIDKLLTKQNVPTHFTNLSIKEHLVKHIILYKYSGIYIKKYLLTEQFVNTLHTLIVQDKIIYHNNIGFFYYSSNHDVCEYCNVPCLIRDDIIIVKSSTDTGTDSNSRPNYVIRKIVHELKYTTEPSDIPTYSRKILRHLYSNLPYYDRKFINTHSVNYDRIIDAPIFNHIDTIYPFNPSTISLNGTRVYFNSYFHKIIDVLPVIPYTIYLMNKEFSSIALIVGILICCVQFLHTIKWKTIHEYLIPKPNPSKIYYPAYKFYIFRKIQKQWKTIREEALSVYNTAPRLDVTRTQTDWKNSQTFVNSVKDQYGWIRSWGTSNPSIGNTDWLNYGLVYYNTEFSQNTAHCPKTIVLLREISEHINICGFSLLLPNTEILPHTDDTGLSHGSLAMHLGLVIPSKNLCQLAVQDHNQMYCCKEEQEGKMIVFDATHEHGAYNYSNEPRIILYIDFVCSKNQA